MDHESAPRVLVFHPALAPYRLDFFNALARLCTLRVVFLRTNLLDQKFDQVRLRDHLAADHGYLRVGLTLLGRTLRVGFAKELHRFQPNVVVTSEFSQASLSILALRYLKRGAFTHAVWTDDNPMSVTRDTAHRRAFRRFVLPRIDGLVVLSAGTADMYRSRFGTSAPIGTAPLLHNEEVFRTALQDATTAAHAHAQHHDLLGKRVVLFVGRLAPEKRLDRLIEAFARIHKFASDAVLVIVGDGPQRDSLRELARETGISHKTVFAGRFEGTELLGWYRLASVFALASDYEPYGAVVNEALLAGVPVVCAAAAGARVLIRPGHNGAVVDASDEDALGRALLHWIDDACPTSRQVVESVRPSLMFDTFSESVTGFFDVITAARRGRCAPATDVT
jgi:glycosyltransferase involved in cell wall biosynthesis